MRYHFWFLAALSLISASADASSKGSREPELGVKDIVIEKEDFTGKVTNLPPGYTGGFDCRCTSEVHAPEILEFPSSAIGRINESLQEYAMARTVDSKSNYDNCQGNKVTYQIPAANQRFVSVRYISEISCGAYPVSTSEGLSFDSRTGKRINWRELIDASKLGTIEDACLDQYGDMINASEGTTTSESGGIDVPQEMFALKDKDLSQSFVVTEDKKLLLLMDEKFWPHAAGSIDCTAPKEALKPAFYELFKARGGL